MFQYAFGISRYFSSAFLSHATAEDLKTNFEKSVATFPLTKRLQIPTKGSYINQRFYSQFFEHVMIMIIQSLLDIGLCGFRVLHSAFQRGNRFVGQKLNETVRAVYRLYKGSPTLYYLNSWNISVLIS